MDCRFVDVSGKEIPRLEGKKILTLVGLDDVVDTVQSTHAVGISTVLGELAALSRRTDRPLHVSYRFDKESGKWFASVEDIRTDFKIEMEFEEKRSRDGLTYWEATFKLPFEWSTSLILVSAVFARLNEKVVNLEMKVDELKGLYGDTEETLKRLSSLSPKSLRRLKRVATQLSRLAKALEEIEEEEEEEEEEEW